MKTFLSLLNKEIQANICKTFDPEKDIKPRAGVLMFSLPTDVTLAIRLTRKDLRNDCFSRTKYFNITYFLDTPTTSGEHIPHEHEVLMRKFTAAVTAHEWLLNRHMIETFFPFEHVDGAASDTAVQRTIDHTQFHVGTIKLTYRCNVRCPFCATKKDMLPYKNKPEVSRDTVYQMLSALRKNFNKVDLDGGDPTISPHVIPAIQYARELGFERIGIVTNGIRLADKDFCEALFSAGLNAINFSLHAVRPSISRKAYGAPAWNMQKKALANIQQMRTRTLLTLQCVLSTINQEHLKDIVLKYVSYAPDEIVIIYCFTPGFLADLESHHILRTIDDIRTKNPDIHIVLRSFPFCKVPPHYWHELQTSNCPTAWPKKRSSWKKKACEMPKPTTRPSGCLRCICKHMCSFPAHEYARSYPVNFQPISDLQGIDIPGC